MDEIKQDLEMIGVGFNFLKLAIEDNDPKEQLLLRVTDEHQRLIDVIKKIIRRSQREGSIMILWAIKSGRILLPYTIRTTRKQAISDHCLHTRRKWDLLKLHSTAVKVDVTELPVRLKGTKK